MTRIARIVTVVGLLAALAIAGRASATLTLVTKWGGAGSGDGQFQVPQNVAVDSQGNVYVADSNNERIQKFDPNGGFILKWGTFGSNPGQLGTPRGVALDAADNVYVVDSGNYRVQKFTSNGTFIQMIGRPSPTPNNPGPGEYSTNPRSGAVGPNGHFYVTEPSRVLEFLGDGTFVRTWGSQGTGPGQFRDARGITVDQAGSVYVADHSNTRIDKFTADGQFVSSFGSIGRGPGQISGPYAVAISPDGHLFVADDQAPGIVEFTTDGTWIQRDEDVQGDLFVPQGIAFNRAGDLYITDNQANTGDRVLKVHPSAAPLPPPEVAKTVNVEVDRGTVLVKLPPGATPKLGAAQNGFVKLTQATQIPVGSFVDATRGTLGMTAAAGTGAGPLQNGTFTGGQFQILQKRALHAVTELRMSQRLTCASVRGRASASAARRTRRLSGNARGRFRTRGRYSTATVRGTQWLVKDTCKNTLTLVRQGTVVVADLVKHKNVTLKKGQRYLARAR